MKNRNIGKLKFFYVNQVALGIYWDFAVSHATIQLQLPFCTLSWWKSYADKVDEIPEINPAHFK